MPHLTIHMSLNHHAIILGCIQNNTLRVSDVLGLKQKPKNRE